jgi:ankyrin repeat protein
MLISERERERERNKKKGLNCLQVMFKSDNISLIRYLPLRSSKQPCEVRNADINARYDDGRTALRIARGNSHDIVAYLISKGGIE